jgi:hypothetical protein
MPSAHEAVRALAATQDGQFATAQALDQGLTYDAVIRLHRSGQTMRLRRGVWRYQGAPGDADAAVTAYLACWPHGVISHASAAHHHGLRRVDARLLPEILVPYGSPRSPAGVRVYRTRQLPGRDIKRVGGIKYTSLARTVCDLADAEDVWETLAIVDDAVALGARPGWLHSTATRLANGRAGIATVRDATAPGAGGVFRSWLERAAGAVYRAAHIPEPEWNVRAYDADGLIGVVDALWRPWRVVAEKEGLRFHTTPRQRRADAKRFNRLVEARYDPRRFTWEDVVHRPVEVAATVLRALRAAGADVDLARLPSTIEIPQLCSITRG